MHIIPQNSQNINNNKLNTALEMVRQGFHLIPLKPNSKAPYAELIPFNKWSLLRDNQATANMVKNWFAADRNINFGVITGTEFNNKKLIVVDLDKKPTAEQLKHSYTPVVETSRGYHLYYLADKKPKAHKTPRGEIKTNGYVVAPPSIHPTGDRYLWCDYMSFVDLPLADFASDKQAIINYLTSSNNNNSTPNTTTSKRPKRELNTTINIYSSVEDGLKVKAVNDPKANVRQFKEVLRSEKAVLELARRVFGVKVSRTGRAFKCFMHEESNPSAALYRADSGDIGIKDFHRAGRFYTLPEAYYTFVTGKDKKLRSGSFIIWLIRLLREAKFVELPRIAPPKKLGKLSENQRRLYKGFIELLEVQQGYKADQKHTAPFSHRFAADWVNMNYDSVRSAKRGLSKKGYIEKVEAGDRKTRKAGKWGLVRGVKNDN